MNITKEGRKLLDQLDNLAKSNPTEVFKVGVCSHTGEEVVQCQNSDGSWLCLHDEEEES